MGSIYGSCQSLLKALQKAFKAKKINLYTGSHELLDGERSAFSSEKANNCNNKDLPDSRQLDKRLRASLADSIIESFLCPIVVTDSRGCVTWVNSAFQKIFGYNWDEINGKFLAELSPSKAGQYKTVSGEIVEVDEFFSRKNEKGLRLYLKMVGFPNLKGLFSEKMAR